MYLLASLLPCICHKKRVSLSQHLISFLNFKKVKKCILFKKKIYLYFLICKSRVNIDWGPWYINLNVCTTSSIFNSTHMIDISNMIWKNSFKNDFYESSYLSIRQWLLPSIQMKCTYSTPEHGHQRARGNRHWSTHPFWTILSL